MKTLSPVVSVILPTYNRSHMLGEAIQSVLDQTFERFELIVIDDGSADATAEVVASFTDPRVRYIRQENGGLANARNTGIRHAWGPLVTFLDDDDLFVPTKLALQSEFMLTNAGIGWAAGGTYLVDDSLTPMGEQRPWLGYRTLDVRTWLSECPVPVHAVMVRRCWLEKVNGFDEAQRQAEDWDLWLRLAYAGCPMALLPHMICLYRLHGQNMTTNTVESKKYILLMLDKFFSLPDLPGPLRDLQPVAYARMYLQGAVREYRGGKLAEATADVESAFDIVPQDQRYDLQEFFLQLVVSWAGHPLTPDPYGYINQVFDNLPPNTTGLRELRRKALAQFSMSQFFQAKEREYWPQVRQMFVKGVASDPTWLGNRGVWSIIATAILGPRLRSWLRKIRVGLNQSR